MPCACPQLCDVERMNILDAITMARAAGETLKALQDIDHAIDKAELKSKLADAIGNLADVRIALADTRDEIEAKDAEIAKLKAAFAIRVDLIEEKGFKYRRAAEDPKLPAGAPICPRCETVDGRLIFTVRAVGHGFRLICPECERLYAATEWLREPAA